MVEKSLKEHFFAFFPYDRKRLLKYAFALHAAVPQGRQLNSISNALLLLPNKLHSRGIIATFE